MKFFAQGAVDLRNRSSMVAFLSHHFRYERGYAARVKVHDLGLTREQQNAALDLIYSDEGVWDSLSFAIDDFTARQGGRFTITTGGRSSGYLVLHSSRYEELPYKSRCKTCYQLNYKKVAELPQDPVERSVAESLLKSHNAFRDEVYLEDPILANAPGSWEEKMRLVRRLKEQMHNCTLDNRCGHCQAEGEKGRVNLKHPVRQLVVMTAKIDSGLEWEDWEMSDLREQVKLVQDFDRTCDQIRDEFILMCASCKIVEETILVPKTVKRIVCAGDSA